MILWSSLTSLRFFSYGKWNFEKLNDFLKFYFDRFISIFITIFFSMIVVLKVVFLCIYSWGHLQLLKNKLVKNCVFQNHIFFDSFKLKHNFLEQCFRIWNLNIELIFYALTADCHRWSHSDRHGPFFCQLLLDWPAVILREPFLGAYLSK